MLIWLVSSNHCTNEQARYKQNQLKQIDEVSLVGVIVRIILDTMHAFDFCAKWAIKFN